MNHIVGYDDCVCERKTLPMPSLQEQIYAITTMCVHGDSQPWTSIADIEEGVTSVSLMEVLASCMDAHLEEMKHTPGGILEYVPHMNQHFFKTSSDVIALVFSDSGRLVFRWNQCQARSVGAFHQEITTSEYLRELLQSSMVTGEVANVIVIDFR